MHESKMLEEKNLVSQCHNNAITNNAPNPLQHDNTQNIEIDQDYTEEKIQIVAF